MTKMGPTVAVFRSYMYKLSIQVSLVLNTHYKPISSKVYTQYVIYFNQLVIFRPHWVMTAGGERK